VESSEDEGHHLPRGDPTLSKLGKPTTNFAARAAEAAKRGLAAAHAAASVPMDTFFSGLNEVLLTCIIGLSPTLCYLYLSPEG
jgi:hypothetical protein